MIIFLKFWVAILGKPSVYDKKMVTVRHPFEVISLFPPGPGPGGRGIIIIIIIIIIIKCISFYLLIETNKPFKGGRKKQFDILGEMSPKLWPLPSAQPRNKLFVFFPFYIDISLEPVHRLGVTIQKFCLIKKIFQGMLNIFLHFVDFFWGGRGSIP